MKGTQIGTVNGYVITMLTRPMDDEKLYCVYKTTKRGYRMAYANVDKSKAYKWATK